MQQSRHPLHCNFRLNQSVLQVYRFWNRFRQYAGDSIRVLRHIGAGRRYGILLSAFFLLLMVPLIASAASITLSWEPNNPPPLEYKIFLRKSGKTYDYSSPAWHGTATQCTLGKLEDGMTYYAVARTYAGTSISTNSNEVKFITPIASTNQAPVAQAGSDQAVSAGSKVTLDGSASKDPDGSIAAYQWTQTSGQTVSLANASKAQASFYAPEVTIAKTLTFQIKVTDQQGLSTVDTCAVTVVPKSQSGSSNTDGQSTSGNTGSMTGKSVIVDNTDAAFSTVGSWGSSAFVAGYYGTNYAYANAGNGSAEATFTFQIPTNGNYEIAAQWSAHGSRASEAPFTIINNGVVVDIIFVDQRTDGGQFNLLTGPASGVNGIYALDAGVLEVVVSNDTTGNVVADAVQVMGIGSSDTPNSSDAVDQGNNSSGGTAGNLQVVLDNKDSAFSKLGVWKSSVWTSGFYGSNYVYANAGNGSASATFTFQVPISGNYKISAQWTAHSSRAPDAPFVLFNNGVMVDTIYVDQRIDGGQFNPLTGAASMGNGVYWIEAGSLKVTLNNYATGNVVADAVRIER